MCTLQSDVDPWPDLSAVALNKATANPYDRYLSGLSKTAAKLTFVSVTLGMQTGIWQLLRVTLLWKESIFFIMLLGMLKHNSCFYYIMVTK